MVQENNLIKTGQFYCLYDKDDASFVLEDRTKRGLPVIDYSVDSINGFMAEIGRFYDGNGRSHSMPIRWHIPKDEYNLEQALQIAERLDIRYRNIMRETCPDY
jgi:hypothetical protein